MATAPQPKLLSDRVLSEISELLRTQERFLDEHDARIIGWTDELEKQMKGGHGRSDAMVGMASVRHIAGDKAGAERLLDRAEGAGKDRISVAAHRARLLQNLSDFSGAVAAARDVPWTRLHMVEMGLGILAGSGAFRSAAELVEQGEKAHLLGLAPSHELKQIAAWASASEVDEDAISTVLDIAGKLMVDRRLFWLDHSPTIQFDDEMQCPGVRFFVAVSPEDAAEMNDEFTRLVVAQELDLTPVTVGFVGVIDSVPEAKHADITS